MPRAMRTIGMLVLLASLGGPALAVEGDVNLLLGQNSLSEGRLDEADVGSAFEIGVMVDLDFGIPVSVALDLLRSSDDATQNIPTSFPLSVATDVETLDFHVGVRKFFREGEPLRPYVGGGLAWTSLDVKQVENGSLGPGAAYSDTVVDDSDSAVGYWLNAGLVYRFERFQLGGDLRFADASAKVQPAAGGESLELDSGGFHAGVFVGWTW